MWLPIDYPSRHVRVSGTSIASSHATATLAPFPTPVTSLLQLDRVWKRYYLGEHRGASGLFHRSRRQELWSLQDVSLRVEPGESVGLIGHNGAGKTTSLKLLAGITSPTRGQVTTRGRIASLINLGAGFHRELTGRENVYLNGVILGLTRREVRDRFDEIVQFAELSDYIDTPVKQYSSGMYARLGFAVAVHVDPDVLLVDEVLSVGDVGFQDRSIRKMLSFRERGCSVLFVSHNLSAIEMMCQRVVWLDHGRIRLQGPTSEVVPAYLDDVDRQLMGAIDDEVSDDASDQALAVEDVTLHREDGQISSEYGFGRPLLVRLHCVARGTLKNVQCRVTIRGDYGPLFSASTEKALTGLDLARGLHVLECRFEDLPLLPGLYRVETTITHDGLDDTLVPHTLATFRVDTALSAFGSQSLVGATKSRGGFLAVPYEWRLKTVDADRKLAGLALPDLGRSPKSPPTSVGGRARR